MLLSEVNKYEKAREAAAALAAAEDVSEDVAKAAQGVLEEVENDLNDAAITE